MRVHSVCSVCAISTITTTTTIIIIITIMILIVTTTTTTTSRTTSTSTTTIVSHCAPEKKRPPEHVVCGQVECFWDHRVSGCESAQKLNTRVARFSIVAFNNGTA